MTSSLLNGPKLFDRFELKRRVDGALTGQWFSATAEGRSVMAASFPFWWNSAHPGIVLHIARASASITSPHLTPILGSGQLESGDILVVYECASVPHQALPAGLPLPRLVDIGLALCDVLDQLHQAGTVAGPLCDSIFEFVDSAVAPAGVRIRLPGLPLHWKESWCLQVSSRRFLDPRGIEVSDDILELGATLQALFSTPETAPELPPNRRHLMPAWNRGAPQLRPLPSPISALLKQCQHEDPSRRPTSVAAVAAVLFPFRSKSNAWTRRPVLKNPPPRARFQTDLDQLIARAEAIAASVPSIDSFFTVPRSAEQDRLNLAAAYYVRGQQHLDAKEPAAALADFSRAVVLHDCNQNLLGKAAVCLAMRELDNAAELLRAIRLRCAQPPEKIFGFGENLRIGKLEEAESYHLLALLAHRRDDLPGAVTALSHAIELRSAHQAEEPADPCLARYYALRSVFHHLAGDFRNAVIDCAHALRYHPDCADYFFSRAVSWHALGDYREALADYARAIERDPNNGEYYFHRSATHRDAGNRTAAARDLTTAQRLGYGERRAGEPRSPVRRE